MFPRSTHETFAQKLYQTLKNHKRFNKPKLSRSDFTICHYAGDVTYQTEFFLNKNKNYVVAEHQTLLYASKCPFVSGLFPPSPEESSKQSKFFSIGSQSKFIWRNLCHDSTSSSVQLMRKEIEQLKHKLQEVETERDDLRERMLTNERQIQKNYKMLLLLMEKIDVQPPEL